jgi:uncharacterized protein YeeX (DUF496 family)
MKLTKQTIDRFSSFVEQYKLKYKIPTYVEALETVINENMFDFITADNVKNFISKNLKEKLFEDYSVKRCIKREFVQEKKLF